MLVLFTAVQARHLTRPSRQQIDRQAGQATAEYALVLLGAAAVAIVFAAWAVKSGKIAELFDKVFDLILSRTK